jgi:hypothetical protein
MHIVPYHVLMEDENMERVTSGGVYYMVIHEL